MNLLNYFKLKENNTTIKTEFFAGLTIFFSMVYILMVNATMFTDPFGNGTNVLGVSYNAIYISTAISAVVGCFLMGILANVPLALASGMGLNAFFVYTACVGFGLTYANALVLILLDGLLFVLFTLTGTLKFIFSGIPKSIRSAISVGIGLFIALLALQSSGVIIKSSSTGIALTSFNILKMSWAQMISPIISIVGVFIISIMAKRVKKQLSTQ